MAVSGPYASKNEPEEADVGSVTGGGGRPHLSGARPAAADERPSVRAVGDHWVHGDRPEDVHSEGDPPEADLPEDDLPEIDLRTDPAVRSIGGGAARLAPVTAVTSTSTVRPATSAKTHPKDHRQIASPVEPGSLTLFVQRLFLPAVAVLLVAVVLAAGIVQYARTRLSAADEISASLSHEQSVQRDLDDLWTGLLGLTANGVANDVTTFAEVARVAGRATSNTSGPLPATDGDMELLRSAQRTHRAFVSAATDVIDADGGSPLSVGNELSTLAPAHAAAVEDLDKYTDSLKAIRGDLETSSELWSGVALAVVIAGLVGAGVLAFGARRKATAYLDDPAQSTAQAVRGVAEGDFGTRSGVTSLTGLGAMATSIDASLDEIAGELDTWRRKAEWGERSTMIFEALDEAQDEVAAYQVVERALALIDDDHHPVELLISDRGSNRIRPVANDPLAPQVGNVVADANVSCLAMRRGQVSVFSSSNSINACPMIRDRPDGPCSAVCVPISVGGRPTGVFHMIGPEFSPPGEEVISRLVNLAVQLGNRLGALRTLESSRKEASTDGLTGLPNRRMLQGEVASLLASETPFVMVLADLDKFKRLNDNYGHEVGDKALKLFAEVLKKNVRGNDLVARIGGEEFVLVYPNMSVQTSIEAIGRLRHALAGSVGSSPIPAFTCSFGISDSSSGVDCESILRVADAGLLKAKELGGDQAVYAESDLVQEVFGEGAERPESDPDRR